MNLRHPPIATLTISRETSFFQRYDRLLAALVLITAGFAAACLLCAWLLRS